MKLVEKGKDQDYSFVVKSVRKLELSLNELNVGSQ